MSELRISRDADFPATPLHRANKPNGLPDRAVLAGLFFTAVAVVTLMAVGLLLQTGDLRLAPARRMLSPGMPAPDFALYSDDRRVFRLSDYAGRAVFVVFVPGWSDSKTIAELRSLAASIRNFDDAGAKVLVISRDDPAKAAALSARERLPFPLLDDVDGAIAKLYSVAPGDFRTTFVVNPAGQVKFRIGDAAVDVERHGKQLLDVSKCCIDDVLAARTHGIGHVLGNFSLPDASDGKMATLMGDGKQRATVVLFLSVKCPCSNAYNARIAALTRSFERNSMRFIGVYSNQDESSEEIAAHAKTNRFDFPILKDDRALCADHLGASVTPEVFVIDNQSVLRYAGRIDDSRDGLTVMHRDLSDAVYALLAGRKPNMTDTRAFGCAIVRK